MTVDLPYFKLRGFDDEGVVHYVWSNEYPYMNAFCSRRDAVVAMGRVCESSQTVNCLACLAINSMNGFVGP
jgi:hypothetical protein